jgi:hypothetical protein
MKNNLFKTALFLSIITTLLIVSTEASQADTVNRYASNCYGWSSWVDAAEGAPDLASNADLADFIDISHETDSAYSASTYLEELTCTSFDATSLGTFNSAKICMSFAGTSSFSMDFLDMYYYYGSGDELLDSIAADGDPSNYTNGGYWCYDAPYIDNWSVIANTDVYYTPVSSGYLAEYWIDAVWVEVTYTSSTISISGSCKDYDQSTNCPDSQTVKVAVDGTLQAQTTTTSSGAFTISGVTASSGAIITVFLDNVVDANEAVAVTKYDGTGDISGVLLYEEHLTIGSADNQTISNINLAQYDNSVSGDEDIFYEIDSNNDLTVDYTNQTTQEELYIVSGNTYQPDSTNSGDVNTHDIEIDGTFVANGNIINLSGDWDNDATFTAGSSTVKLTPFDTGVHVIYGNTTFYNLTAENFSISCGESFVKSHTAGDVAPVNKTVSYGTVATSLSGSEKCWVTKNLGATDQASSATDSDEDSAGWYWQFNRKQGYKHDGSTITPGVPSETLINENSAWLTANDPCTLELGTGWRLPTYTELYNTDINGSWSNYTNTYSSVHKLHAAGYIQRVGGVLSNRGTTGYYWTSTQYTNENSYSLTFTSSTSLMSNFYKSTLFNVRCLRDDNSIPLKNNSITFLHNSETSIASGGNLIFSGTPSNELIISSDNTTSWLLHADNSSTVQMNYVNVSYSDASGYKTIVASNGTNTDGGNNTNWEFTSIKHKNIGGNTNFNGAIAF